MNRNTTTGDSAVVPETPKLPRGILKQNDVSQKKRRVAFAGSDEQRTSSEEEGDEKQVLNFISFFLMFALYILPLSPLWCFFHFNTEANLPRKLNRLNQ